MLSVRSHGWLRDNEEYFRKRYLSKYNVSEFESNYFFVFPGLNVRSTDLNAFIGRKQLKKMDFFVKMRNKNHNRFCDNLKGELWTQRSQTETVSSLGFGLLIKNREKMVNKLIENKIECRPLICGSIQEHPFWPTDNKKSILPNASKVHKNGLYVPCHQGMSDKEVDFICNLLRSEHEDR